MHVCHASQSCACHKICDDQVKDRSFSFPTLFFGHAFIGILDTGNLIDHAECCLPKYLAGLPWYSHILGF
jgi:hypothetical protein